MGEVFVTVETDLQDEESGCLLAGKDANGSDTIWSMFLAI